MKFNPFEMIFGVALVMSAAEKEEGLNFLAQNAEDPETTTLESGLQYKVLAAGPLEGQMPQAGSRCVCGYTSAYANGTIFLEHLGDRNVTLVAGSFLKGVAEALSLMHEGDKWKLVLPPDLGYGSRGSPPTIPADAVLQIELELLQVNPPGMFVFFGIDFSRWLGVILLGGFQIYNLFFAPSEADKRKGKPLTVADASSAQHPRVYMDIHVGGKPAGRVEFELFETHFPKTSENFRALCTGEKGAKLNFAGCPFHRVVPGFVCQGGDVTEGNGTGGQSIYGEAFDHEFEKGVVGHTQPYLLSMASAGFFASNTSQFCITFAKLPHLDGKHVVFGKLVSGEEGVQAIEAVGSGNGRTYQPVTITACGESKAGGRVGDAK